MNEIIKAAALLSFALLSVWDLLTSKMPLMLLVIFLGLSMALCLSRGPFAWIISAVTALALTGSNISFVRKKQMGSGDLWIMGALAFMIRPDVFPAAMIIGSVHLLISALIREGFFGRNSRIPLTPYLLLGFLIGRGW